MHKYQVFLKTVELGNLTRAAELLGYTQSGVSHIINGLEKEWGFPLLVRHKNGVKLTPNGEKVIDSMKQIVKWDNHLSQTVDAIQGLQTGLIRIGTFASVSVNWLPKIMKEFLHRYPFIEFELKTGDYENIENWIRDEAVDIGFLTEYERQGIQFVPLLRDEIKAILPEHHAMGKLSKFPLDQFAKEPFILPGEGFKYDIGEIFCKAGIQPMIKFTADDDYGTIAMVESGLGISLLPDLIFSQIKRGILVKDLEDYYYRTIGVGVRSLKNASPATKLFVKFILTWTEKYKSGIGPSRLVI